MLAFSQEPNTSHDRESYGREHRGAPSARERCSAMASTPSGGRRRTRGRPAVLRIDPQRLVEVVHACGYDARRICQHLGISTRSLQRWFCAHMSCTPCSWLIEQRLQRARRLLQTSSSVKEVAYSLGFKQASQFSRDYKRRFGHQPSVELTRAKEQGQPCAPPRTSRDRHCAS